jgi:NADH-quinone oxidoreductase subunit M
VFSFQATALHGALLQILSHGVVVAGMFLMLGLLEQRCGRDGTQTHALASAAPRFAVLLMLFVLASLALPLTSGFTAEFLVLLGAFTQGLAAWRADAGAGLLVLAVLACGGVVLGATIMLRFARAAIFGSAATAGPDARLRDLGARETLALLPLLAVVLCVGVAPAAWMAKVEPAVAALLLKGTP